MGNLLIKVISVKEALDLVGAGVKYNAEIEQLQTSFATMTGSAEEAAKIVAQIQELAAFTPYGLKEMATTVKTLMGYGFTPDESIQSMVQLGDIAQGDAAALDRLSVAYGQMRQTRSVYQRDVNQMINNGFNPLLTISEATGESMACLYDRMSKGSLAFDEITFALKAATSEGGLFFKSMDKQSKTLKGRWETLRDESSMLWGDVLLPVNDSLRDKFLPAATEAVRAVHDAFESGGYGGIAKHTAQGWLDLLFPQTSDRITYRMPEVEITNKDIMSDEAASIVETFHEQLQNGMNQQQALDFIMQITATNADQGLHETIKSLYDQFFTEKVSVPVTPEMQQPDTSGMPDIIDVPVTPQIQQPDTSGMVDIIDIPVKPAIQQPEPANMPDIIDVPVNPTIEAPDVSATMTAAGTTAGQSYSDGMASGISGSTAVTGAASALTGSIQSAITPAIGTARLQGVGISGALGSGISTGSFAALTAANNLSSGISVSVRDAVGSASGSGLNFSLGLAGGIRAGRSAVVNAAASVAQAAMQAVQSTLQIHSPSRVTESFGEFFSEGFARGIVGNAYAATSAAAEMAQMASDAVSIRNPGAGVNRKTTQQPTTARVEIDYERLGESVADALARRPPVVNIDGKRVTDVVTRGQNQNARARAMGLGK